MLLLYLFAKWRRKDLDKIKSVEGEVKELGALFSFYE